MVYAINHSNVHDQNVGQAHWLVRLLLVLFVVICVFDPADQVLGGKVFIFVSLWVVTLVKILLTPEDVNLRFGLVAYVVAFNAIPIMSIFWYYVINGQQPFEGFALLKGYLLLTLAIVLVLNGVDLIRPLSAVLAVMAVAILAVFVYLQIYPEQFAYLNGLGMSTGILSLDQRKYGDDLELLQVYFVTSAMLVVSITYYFDRAMSAPRGRMKFVYWILVAINILGMFVAGTRNNILASFLLPFLLWPLYTRRVLFSVFCSVLVLACLALVFSDQLEAFFDSGEGANRIKLALLQDYVDLFSNPVTLLFGQGLGAYHFWNATANYFYVTELTYLEMIRNFGLFGAAALAAILLFPVARVFATPTARPTRALAVAYSLYLVMSFSNPLLFSSTGMLILAVLIANTALKPSQDRKVRALS